ncbi:uncharacterized protein [Antedon mediterranea]|uniref:uncharacterized protein n=1 Tax=Antedon mediterranea TaxID=105859 RepID=UPI003AF8D981
MHFRIDQIPGFNYMGIIQLDSILLNSSVVSHHFVERDSTYSFTLLSPVCACTPHCIKEDGAEITILTHVNRFRLSIRDQASSGFYKCSLIYEALLQFYQFTLNVYVPSTTIELDTNITENFNDQNIVSVTVSQTTKVNCYSYGMRPPGQIMILLGHELISKTNNHTTNKNDTSLFDVFNSVNIIQNWTHDGLSVYCIVNQSQIKDKETGVESRHIKLQVIIEFLHKERLYLGYHVSEGDDVILNCSSNYPYAASYTWKHIESGETVSNDRILNYTDITSSEAGNYTCTVDPEKQRSAANVTTFINVSRSESYTSTIGNGLPTEVPQPDDSYFKIGLFSGFVLIISLVGIIIVTLSCKKWKKTGNPINNGRVRKLNRKSVENDYRQNEHLGIPLPVLSSDNPGPSSTSNSVIGFRNSLQHMSQAEPKHEMPVPSLTNKVPAVPPRVPFLPQHRPPRKEVNLLYAEIEHTTGTGRKQSRADSTTVYADLDLNAMQLIKT